MRSNHRKKGTPKKMNEKLSLFQRLKNSLIRRIVYNLSNTALEEGTVYFAVSYLKTNGELFQNSISFKRDDFKNRPNEIAKWLEVAVNHQGMHLLFSGEKDDGKFITCSFKEQ